ncbi:MAG: FliM/FliN family flagellar motor switch protein [Candidatus Acidiferrales bacterium]|jgi:flagellar motor switch protein FliN/FliY
MAANPIAVMPAPAAAAAGEPADSWGELLQVSTTVTVDVPIAKLTVRELFQLQKGSVLASTQLSGVQVPITVSGRLIAWGEFQVSGDHLALRVVELA